MIPRWPRSLLGRNVLLLVTLVVVSQACAIVIFISFIQGPRIDEAAEFVASQIALVERLVAALPEPARKEALTEVDDVPKGTVSLSSIDSALPPVSLVRRFFVRLAILLPPGVRIRWENEGSEHRLWVRFPKVDESRWILLPVATPYGRLPFWSLIVQLLVLATLPTLAAYLIHWRIEGPLQRLARAAACVERGQWPEAVSVEGPLELATVAEAFNRMMSSLAELETTRAEMLGGISHDIRTPLTKLRMVLAAPEAFDSPAATAERFVEEIDVIVQQFIDFARGSASEAAVPGNLNALVEQLASDYAGLGQPFALTLEPLPLIRYRPVNMQRLLMNLMQNATVYGRVGLAIGTRVVEGWIVISVEDGGPGVAPDVLEQIKQPFRRGSHPEKKGGTGLGLAIAERVALQHGGSLNLMLREEGGLKVIVRIPS